ncbi:hypothetical protein Tco_0139067 [Tanacetum coccineum]
MCCDDTHDVAPRVSSLAGCDRLVSDPLVIENYISIYGLLDIKRSKRGANVGGASRGTEGGRVVKGVTREDDSDLLSDARSRPGPAESGVSCESKVKPKRDPANAIKNKFGGNIATKKTQKNLLKQQYENFAASSTEVIEQTYERLQKLISQLEMHGEVIPQEDINQKFLRSLSQE